MSFYIAILLNLLICSTALCQSIYEQIDYTNYESYAPFQEEIDTRNFNAERLNACIFFATNKIRVKKRLNPVNYNAALEASSMLHSTDMAKLDFFNHTNKKNKKRKEPEDRAREVGISNPYIAENIIEGFVIKYKSGMKVLAKEPGVFTNPKTGNVLGIHTYLSLTKDILDMWMHSEGHRKNILSKDALQLGCGTALYFMTDFNQMPVVKATQSFQWFHAVETK